MTNLYEKDSIIEAVCQFKFISADDWDLTIPGLIYDKIKGEYPDKQQVKTPELEFSSGNLSIKQVISSSITQMRFMNNQKNSLIQIGLNMISINQLKPYSKWEDYKIKIKQALDIYLNVTNPESIKSIGLRYINRIEPKLEKLEIEDYILAVPKVPDQLPQNYRNWVQRVEIPYNDGRDILIIQTGLAPSDVANKIALLLDLDYIINSKIEFDHTMDWVEQAHNNVEEAFEACITDNTRKLLNPINSN